MGSLLSAGHNPGNGIESCKFIFMVVIVFGLPGSGKSYFASRLAKKIGAEYINSDRLRKQMFARRNYSNAEKAAVYDEMLQRMAKAIYEKRNIVLDATFHKKAARELFEHDKRLGDTIYFIEVVADEELVKERVALQRPDSDADFEVYKLIRDQWEAMDQPHLILRSTNDNLDDMLQKANLYLKFKNDKGTGT